MYTYINIYIYIYVYIYSNITIGCYRGAFIILSFEIVASIGRNTTGTYCCSVVSLKTNISVVRVNLFLVLCNMAV